MRSYEDQKAFHVHQRTTHNRGDVLRRASEGNQPLVCDRCLIHRKWLAAVGERQTDGQVLHARALLHVDDGHSLDVSAFGAGDLHRTQACVTVGHVGRAGSIFIADCHNREREVALEAVGLHLVRQPADIGQVLGSVGAGVEIREDLNVIRIRKPQIL